jgi:signal transduction histidine kinase
MQGTIIGNGLDHDCTIPAPGSSKASHRLLSDRLQSYIGCVIIIAASFLADIVLPRGATPAIGYCLVPALARAAGRRSLFLLTGICIALTWIGYILEPAGAAWWMSVFDRAMVTGVLWLALLLVWRRLQAESALALQTEALREAVRELHRSNAELENFASIVSHDLRGPLNSIALAIRIISSQPAIHSDPECNQWIDSIVAEIARMSSLIQRLLAYGRIGAGEATLSDCDCESVLNSVRQALRADDGAVAEPRREQHQIPQFNAAAHSRVCNSNHRWLALLGA